MSLGQFLLLGIAVLLGISFYESSKRQEKKKERILETHWDFNLIDVGDIERKKKPKKVVTVQAKVIRNELISYYHAGGFATDDGRQLESLENLEDAMTYDPHSTSVRGVRVGPETSFYSCIDLSANFHEFPIVMGSYASLLCDRENKKSKNRGQSTEKWEPHFIQTNYRPEQSRQVPERLR